jgi:hypothetical protein
MATAGNERIAGEDVKPVDFAKAAGIAAAVIILDLLLAVAAGYVLLAPGHPRAYYATAAVPIALWSTRILGTALIFAACWWSARRNPQRHALVFAVTVVIYYGLIDGVSVGFKGFFTLSFGITMLLKLVAGIAGAQLAVSMRSRGP